MLKEFKPTILFLVKFVGIYLVGNLLYGWFITSYYPGPDPVTNVCATHVASFISTLGPEVDANRNEKKPTVSIRYEDKSILSVYEGCNGINTAIVFVSFIVAFGPWNKNMWWFLLMGIVVIHLANILRITLLFYVSRNMPQFMYFTHKYLFTASLYAIIFVLWIFWVKYFSPAKSSK